MGGGGIKNASITNFLLFTYSENELVEWEKENPGKRQESWAFLPLLRPPSPLLLPEHLFSLLLKPSK